MQYSSTIARLRGFCILAVVLTHYSIFFPNIFYFLGVGLANGYYGVTAFFAVSGFLITSNILKRYGSMEGISFKNFYIMRAARILPALILLLLTLSILDMTDYDGFRFSDRLSLWGSIFYVMTLRYNLYFLYHGFNIWAWAVLWSLSIEEAFYTIYPILIKIFRAKYLMITLLLIVTYGFIKRITDPEGVETIYKYSSCFDRIAMGCLTALAAHNLKGKIRDIFAKFILILGIVVVTATYYYIPVGVNYVIGPSLVGIGSSAILFAAQCGASRSRKFILIDPLALLGNYSYEVYLFHMSIFCFLRPMIGDRLADHPVVLSVIVFSATLATSFAIGRFYAEPLNRLIRRKLRVGDARFAQRNRGIQSAVHSVDMKV